MRRFLENIYNPKAIISSVPRLDFFWNLPYIGNNIDNLDKELKLILNKFYPQINFKFIFTNNFKISNLMSFKDKLGDPMRSGIVYAYNCPNCNVGYLGSSSRALKTRFSEYAGISSRTGRDIAVKLNSSIRDHALSCQVRIKIEHFKIIDHCKTNIDLRILESIYIWQLKPKLNQEQSSFSLYIIQ